MSKAIYICSRLSNRSSLLFITVQMKMKNKNKNKNI